MKTAEAIPNYGAFIKLYIANDKIASLRLPAGRQVRKDVQFYKF